MLELVSGAMPHKQPERLQYGMKTAGGQPHTTSRLEGFRNSRKPPYLKKKSNRQVSGSPKKPDKSGIRTHAIIR